MPSVGSVETYGFDPTHGHTLASLLEMGAPNEPPDYREFWMRRYDAALQIVPRPGVQDTGVNENGWRVFDLQYTSTRGKTIRGWLLLPVNGEVRRALIIGHGYDGRKGPDLELNLPDAALFFPCARGLGRSSDASISAQPHWHVLHDIHSRDNYVLGGCVEDIWTAASAALRLFPQCGGRLGYLGSSFGGGVGAMAVAWDPRFSRAFLHVPSFGHQPLRMQLPSTGSAASVQRFASKDPKVLDVLRYYDAAIAARHIRIPVHCACAVLDPSVAPPCQFAIYNALGGPRSLQVLAAGHHSHPGETREAAELRREVHNFFRDL